MEIKSLKNITVLINANFTDWQSLGEVNVTYHDGLVLFNYSGHCAITGRWNFFERVSRGLIFDSTLGDVVARPFSKFFNYGQELPLPGTHIVEATEKMDGSMGTIYWWKDRWRVATRGSFTSEQAIWAEQELNSGKYDLSWLGHDWTYITEIIYPENRIVVNYGDRRELCLIGARHINYQKDLYWRELEVIASNVGFSLPKHYNFGAITDYLDLAAELSANEEGWVLRYSDHTRFKVKGKAYQIAHKVMTGATPRRVCEALMAGVFDDMIAGVPDEFLTEIRQMADDLRTKQDDIHREAIVAYMKLPNYPERKLQAQWIMQFAKPYSKYIFAMLDERSNEEIGKMAWNEVMKGLKDGTDN